MKTRAVEVSTDNKVLATEPTKITVEIEVTVPENVDEAIEFYGTEEKLIESIQADVTRRKANAARPILRDSTEELDWELVATAAAEEYKPGRRGGFGSVTLSKDEVEEAAAAGDMDALWALLAARGAKLTD